jgi:hypothetical protein
MTVNKLIKLLEKIQHEAGKRATVVIDLGEFKVNKGLIDSYSHYGVADVKHEVILWGIDDSFTLANGEERTKTVVSLSV